MVKYYRTDDKKIYEFSELTQGIWIDMINPTVSEGEEVAEKLADMAIEDEVCASKTKEEYYDEIDEEMHQLQLVAYENGDYEQTSFVYTAVEFLSVNFV